MALAGLAIIVRTIKAIRGFFVAIVLLAIFLPVAIFVLLSSDWAHTQLKEIGEKELTQLLGTEAHIGKVRFSPFNRLDIQDVSIADDNDSTALTVKEIEARCEFWDLVLRRKIIIDYATISGLDLKIYRDSLHTPLNIDRIIKRLSTKDDNKPSAVFKLRLNDVSLNHCNVSYDVLSAPVEETKFTPTHINVSDLSMVAFAPIVSNDEYQVRLRELKFSERSGFEVYNLSVNTELSNTHITLNELNFLMPNSKLSFADITVPIDSLGELLNIGTRKQVSVQLNEGSHVYLPDLKGFVPQLSDLDYNLSLSFEASGTKDSVNIKHFALSDNNGILNIDTHGIFRGIEHPETMEMENVEFDIHTDTVAIATALNKANVHLAPKIRHLLPKLGRLEAKGAVDGSIQNGKFKMMVNSKLAHASFTGHLVHPAKSTTYKVDGKFDVDSLLLGTILNNRDLHSIKCQADVHGTFSKNDFLGEAETDIKYIDFKGYRYKNVYGNVSVSKTDISTRLRVDDPNLSMIFTGGWTEREDSMHMVQGDVLISKLYPDTLNLLKSHPGYGLSGVLHVKGEGRSIDQFQGQLSLRDIRFKSATDAGLSLKELDIIADNMADDGMISVTSEYLNGSIEGQYSLTTISKDIRDIYETLIPALAKPAAPSEGLDTAQESEATAEDSETEDRTNNFFIDLTLTKCENLCEFFKIPVIPIGEASISGRLNAQLKSLFLIMEMPWIESGNNIIQRTSMAVNIKANDNVGDIFLTSYIPTKKGNMELEVKMSIKDGDIHSNIDWSLKPEKPIDGTINFTTRLMRDSEGNLITQINFNPGEINFGDEIWAIQKSLITYSQGKARILNFGMSTPTQSLSANGILGDDSTDLLTVNLNNIQLISIFETLDIDNALISGYATGTIRAEALLSKTPMISCDALKVKSIGYNYCTLGDADVKLSFDDGGKIFKFAGEITQAEGYKSYLDGFIEIATETLNLNIKANHIKVGFMKPFMAAFTSDIDGYATGTAKLFGTFKDLDLTGNINVEDLRIKIDFTNTYYYATDRIVIKPGNIELSNITLTDEYGHKALLNGWVSHKYFHDAAFEFSVTNAKNFLCYDVTKEMSPDWYGRIFGNGSANINGHPGVVNIGVNMSTASNSTFTFVLSNRQDANTYSFITFKDVTPKETPDSILNRVTIPHRVLEKTSNASTTVDSPTEYNMDINMSILPQANMNLVMDPVAGDNISANGEGSIRLYYGSANNDLRLYGTYKLERGSYKFSMQDVIHKEFTIKEGSSIKFTGDPYTAQLDISAYFQVNTNLSDLDESFLQDKNYNNNSIPVRALMQVSGDMLQPDITFDLEFPYQTEDDIYRKVKSIISTEEMMNTQIIYLLALSRFYTPEYMSTTNKTNDLFSVASSTISSQISNMLGKLSDNWSIAPNLRSDRGDFSDLEIDVNLTSTLLNNRLLLNGNFGYRDKSLNTNQFIGDFDVEYLLTRTGEWRLKAYNRYNDQNYYLRTAQTTQGVGIVYRRDFDKTFKFLNNIKSLFRKERADSITSDSIEVRPMKLNVNDSIPQESINL